MKKSFLLGEPDHIHVDIQRLIDTRLLIQANSGGGKSWCLRRILEQTHGAVQHLVIDLPKLADLPAESEQRKRTEEEMRREISTLKRELAAKPKPKPVEVKPERVEVPVLGGKELARLEKSISLMAKLNTSSMNVAASISRSLGDVAAALAKVGRNGHGAIKPAFRETIAQARETLPRPRETNRARSGTHMPRAKQKILDALAFLEEMGIHRAEKTQLALMAGVSPTSGGYFNNLGSMRTEGLIEYPAPNSVSLTGSGRASADSSGAPATTEELHAQIRSRLPAAKWKIVEELVRSYPDARTKDELAEALGVSPTSGGYFNNLGSLRSLGLIDYPSPGQVVALPVLFLEGG